MEYIHGVMIMKLHLKRGPKEGKTGENKNPPPNREKQQTPAPQTKKKTHPTQTKKKHKKLGLKSLVCKTISR